MGKKRKLYNKNNSNRSHLGRAPSRELSPGTIPQTIENPYNTPRQSPFDNNDTKKLSSALNTLQSFYSPEWLSQHHCHPVYLLLKGRDALSSAQLFMLGDAIGKLREVDSIWLDAQVLRTKGEDINNRQGAFFEILQSYMLMQPNQMVVPMKKDNPGADIEVIFSDGRKALLSLKKHRRSVHEEHFAQMCQALEVSIQLQLEQLKKNIQVYIWRNHAYPTETEWACLTDTLMESMMTCSDTLTTIQSGGWSINLREMSDTDGRFYSGKSSYYLLVASPYHVNEQQNMNSKFDSAASNLKKHFPHRSECEANILVIGLPEMADVAQCTHWAEDYFRDHESSPIDAVLFYQPALVQDTQGNATRLSHCVAPVLHKNALLWFEKGAPKINVVFGAGICKQAPLCLVNDRNETMRLPSGCVYQRGNEYIMMKNDYGGFSGHLSSPAPGVMKHAVLKLPDSDCVSILSGWFADTIQIL
ncbi:MAG: hypothetical protein GXY15_13450 [Candidatus Hydrogenedentes bacterium]|nr:hypothetical protein [Candidatus Hydrogenedentota bacterium]